MVGLCFFFLLEKGIRPYGRFDEEVSVGSDV